SSGGEEKRGRFHGRSGCFPATGKNDEDERGEGGRRRGGQEREKGLVSPTIPVVRVAAIFDGGVYGGNGHR
ncbi:hypothetical protein HAX54_024771, partial [Datura stramonium]|nr:hypothetical protein [Datura stramonium]